MAAESALNIAVVLYPQGNRLILKKNRLPMIIKGYFQSNFVEKGWTASAKIYLRAEASHYHGLRQA